jgi:DNA-binding transcriptional regulator GbsR (MarR family)
MKRATGEEVQLEQIRDEFIAQWGAMGTQWGVNRTMAQVHALLMTADEPMCTDEVMEALRISRGNAHSNLKELVAWGLLRVVVRKGERKEFFEAEKDVWKIFTIVARERKRREIDPALQVLDRCAKESKAMRSGSGREFHRQITELHDFVAFASGVADRVGGLGHSKAARLASKIFG